MTTLLRTSAAVTTTDLMNGMYHTPKCCRSTQIVAIAEQGSSSRFYLHHTLVDGHGLNDWVVRCSKLETRNSFEVEKSKRRWRGGIVGHACLYRGYISPRPPTDGDRASRGRGGRECKIEGRRCR